MSDNKNRGRVIAGILYFDDETHKFAYEQLQKNIYKCLYIVHDRDLNEDGEIKKSHIHFVLKFTNARYKKSVAEDLKIEEHLLQVVTSFNSYCTYLIHLDEPMKAQYLPSEVCGNLYNDFLTILSKVDNENIKVLKIINYIYDNQIMSIKSLVTWCCQNGLYDTLRRNYSMFRDIKNEKDGKL